MLTWVDHGIGVVRGPEENRIGAVRGPEENGIGVVGWPAGTGITAVVGPEATSIGTVVATEAAKGMGIGMVGGPLGGLRGTDIGPVGSADDGAGFELDDETEDGAFDAVMSYCRDQWCHRFISRRFFTSREPFVPVTTTDT